jgi:hypothetical protein
MNVEVELSKSYTKKEIQTFLQFSDVQLQRAMDAGLVKFDNNKMYGLFFFQFLKNNHKKLEIIHDGL